MSDLRIHRATAVLLLAGSLLIAAGASAAAEVVSRVAGAEGKAEETYGFDQVSTHCPTSVAARDTAAAYTGEASLAVHTENDPTCSGPYARGIFNANGNEHLVAGDDFWFGAAIYLPIGFYAAHTAYTDLMRVDSYVNDESASTPFANRAEINFASWDDDNLYVRAARGASAVDLIGPLSPQLLPEGAWHWVEIHVDLSSTAGAASTELKIDGRSIGSSSRPNLFAGAEPLNRLRYGIVSTGTGGSGELTAYFDRASIGESERGPVASPSRNPLLLDAGNEAAAARALAIGGAPAFGTTIALPRHLFGARRHSGIVAATSRRHRYATTHGNQLEWGHVAHGIRLLRSHRARGD